MALKETAAVTMVGKEPTSCRHRGGAGTARVHLGDRLWSRKADSPAGRCSV